MRPSQDKLRAFLASHPGATRDDIGEALGLSYPAVVGLCARAYDADWLSVRLEPGKNGRRSNWRYWIK